MTARNSVQGSCSVVAHDTHPATPTLGAISATSLSSSGLRCAPPARPKHEASWRCMGLPGYRCGSMRHAPLLYRSQHVTCTQTGALPLATPPPWPTTPEARFAALLHGVARRHPTSVAIRLSNTLTTPSPAQHVFAFPLSPFPFPAALFTVHGLVQGVVLQRSGATAVGVVSAMRAAAVAVASGLLFCSPASPHQCLTPHSAASAAVVTAGALVWTLTGGASRGEPGEHSTSSERRGARGLGGWLRGVCLAESRSSLPRPAAKLLAYTCDLPYLGCNRRGPAGGEAVLMHASALVRMLGWILT